MMQMPVTLEERLRYYVKPASNTVAKRIPLTAFEGTKKAHPFFHKGDNPDEGAFLPASTVFPSLQQLPNRRIVDILLKVYMKELEPVKNLFNKHILAEQLQELWDDIEQCKLRTDQPVSTPIYYENGDKAQLLDVHFDECRHAETGGQQIQHRLLSTARQGLIALVFTLCDIGARLSDMSSLIEMGLAPDHETETRMLHWCETMGSRASYHLKLSDYAARPTLWTLQVMLLNDLSISAMVKWRQGIGKAYDNHFGTSGLMLSIAVSLGLNNLGSAYEDVRNANDKARTPSSSDRGAHTSSGGKKTDSGSSEEQKTVLATMQHGTWLADFAEGNLAHRELGRKLWAMISTMDALMASHFNQHFNVHDNIDHSAPPAPVDDGDLLSPHAALIIAQSRPDAIVPRDNTFVAYYAAIARATRIQVELENVKGAPLPYKDLLNLDQRFRDIIEILPPYLSLSLVNDGGLAPSSNGTRDPQTEAFIMQRSLINDQAWFRMLRMHRMHLGKGFKDQKYRQSTLSCLEAARGILEARTALAVVDRTVCHALFLLNHLLQAAFVFQLYLLHDLDQRRHGVGKSMADGVYRLDDFDATVVMLQRCLHYLGPDSNVNRGFAQEQIQAVELFLDRLLAPKKRAMDAAVPRASKRARSGSYQATGDHVFVPPLTTSVTPTYSGILQPSFSHANSEANTLIDMGTATSSGSSLQDWSTATLPFEPLASTAATSLNIYDPSIWSLDALFPGYEEGLDLISALENEVLTQNSNLWSGFGPPS
jgi:hypothetical protein